MFVENDSAHKGLILWYSPDIGWWYSPQDTNLPMVKKIYFMYNVLYLDIHT